MRDYRRCSANRAGSVIHLFSEGTSKTLCDREIGDEWLVHSGEELATCQHCVRNIPRTNVYDIRPDLREAQ